MSRFLVFFIMMSIRMVLMGQAQIGMLPKYSSCIVNNNLVHTEVLTLRIEDTVNKTSFRWKIDSMIIDTLGWKNEHSTIELFKNRSGSVKMNFPYRLNLNSADSIYVSIKSEDTLGYLKPFIKARIFKDSSLIPIIVDESVFHFLFKDSLTILKVTTAHFPIAIPKDSVCSNYSPNSFIITTSNNEKSYQWTFDNVPVSNTSTFVFNKSGELKLEVLLQINSCIAKSIPKILYYESYPEKAELTSDAFFTLMYLKNYPIADYKSYRTTWYKDNERYLTKITDTTVSFPSNGSYYALLEGKVCKKKTNTIVVTNSTSKLEETKSSPFFIQLGQQIQCKQSGTMALYELNGRKIMETHVIENQLIELGGQKNRLLLIQFEKNQQIYHSKLLLK